MVGSGSAAMCAALAAIERGASVLVLEKADESLAGGNSRYSAGAMRFAYDSVDDLLPLLRDPSDSRLADTDFGSYPVDKFADDLRRFNDGQDLSPEQEVLIGESYLTLRWLASHGVMFDPIYSRQSYISGDKHVFWGGLTLEADGEGEDLVNAQRDAFLAAGGKILYSYEVTDLLVDGNTVLGVVASTDDGPVEVAGCSVVLACGGFEASESLRVEHLGEEWANAKVRGTPHNTGTGLRLAYGQGAARHGHYANCHATPMDLHMADYGNLHIPHPERKNYRKICYFLGVMVNANGHRFVDEGKDFRNYTYAQFGRSVLEQPGSMAWQLFDSKVDHLLYEEYHFHDAHYVMADSLPELAAKLPGLNSSATFLATVAQFNDAVVDGRPFDPAVLDGRATAGLELAKSNWAQRLDTPPFKAYPVTGGITFTYGGLKVNESGAVLRDDGSEVSGLFACGELVGGVFINGYPGGSGLTSGAVFGRRAGYGAASLAHGLAAS